MCNGFAIFIIDIYLQGFFVFSILHGSLSKSEYCFRGWFSLVDSGAYFSVKFRENKKKRWKGNLLDIFFCCSIYVHYVDDSYKRQCYKHVVPTCQCWLKKNIYMCMVLWLASKRKYSHWISINALFLLSVVFEKNYRTKIFFVIFHQYYHHSAKLKIKIQISNLSWITIFVGRAALKHIEQLPISIFTIN